MADMAQQEQQTEKPRTICRGGRKTGHLKFNFKARVTRLLECEQLLFLGP